jgi:hypothetical protein
MRIIGIPGARITLAVIFCFAVPAEAQLAKRGTFEARFYWKAEGKWYGIATDHSFFTGEVKGTLFNGAGEGFLHRASAVCPAVRDLLGGVVNVHGYCIVTDETDDRAVLACKCKGRDRCEGDFEWVGGTEKYTGLKGRGTFSAAVRDPQADEGSAVLKGQWQLPE